MKMEFPLAALLLASSGAAHALAGEPAAIQPPTKGTAMTIQARGTFEVKVKPLPEDEKVQGVAVGRMSIDKVWSGDIVGTSTGEMMTAAGEVKSSGGYVAVEVMKVSVKGRRGTFTLLHHATMKNNADFKMLISVVPDSGTFELTGISGVLTIVIEPGKHSYVLDYTLPEAR
jgi:hypothetical protein